MCSTAESGLTVGEWYITYEGIPQSTLGWSLMTANNAYGAADIGVPGPDEEGGGIASGRYSVFYVYDAAQGESPGHLKIYCVDVEGGSSHSSSSSGGGCPSLTAAEAGCQWVRLQLDRPSLAPTDDLFFSLYVLSTVDLDEHVWGVNSPIGSQADRVHFVPVAGTTYAEWAVAEWSPNVGTDHTYTVFAEYYLSDDTYVGPSCLLQYRFDPALCGPSGAGKWNRAAPCFIENGEPHFCPRPAPQ